MSSKPAATKRKAPATTTAIAKKGKLAAAVHAETVQSIIANPTDFDLPPTDKETRKMLLELAQYARNLEEEVDSFKPKAKSRAELEAAAAKLASAANSGIKKQCTWKPTCKTGSAKWMYDGVCSDPEVFGLLLGLDGPPTFKTKKMPVDEFHEVIGHLSISARYSHLRITGTDVNIRWKPDEGTFKFSGTYGV